MNAKKEIANNIISLSSINILGILIPIMTMPVLAKSLGSNLYGQYLLFMTIIVFGHTIIDYGTQYTGIREASKARHHKKWIKIIYDGHQGTRWILSTLYIFACILYSYLLKMDFIFNWIIFGGIPYFLGYILSSSWFYQAVGKSKELILYFIFPRIINLITIVICVKSPSDITYAVYSSTWPILISGIILFIKIKNNYKLSIINLSSSQFFFKRGFNSFIGILLPNLYNSLPTIIMGGLFKPSEFAKFAIAIRLSGIAITVQEIIAKSIYPLLSRTKGNHVNKIIKINSLLSIPIIIVILLFGEKIITILLGNEYSKNIYLNILIVSIFFIGLSNSYSEGYFLPKGFDKIYRNISIRISLVSSLLSAILIYKYQITGGAVAIAIARILFFIDYRVNYIKIIKLTQK
ncbi:oligosaccharide flippase family protein [Xenorhabdus ishibashii]|uniref:Translocase n=1 Tax=Xenorhabdus ishibashii TaxID=1034471 RepID=A0A2D0KG17_9GAMM|nr:oligosaccharide flippase family protein [Xenorhabdus ishibashii]PHM62366.1 translocase [Xenorhabdus ishibashii]